MRRNIHSFRQAHLLQHGVETQYQLLSGSNIYFPFLSEMHTVNRGCARLLQICGGYPDAMTRAAQLIEENLDVSFVDVNMGCPIDLICSK